MEIRWIEGLVGWMIWMVANVAYGFFRSSGETGFRRIVAFWMGMPLSWLTLVLLREGVPMRDRDELDFGSEMSELRAAIQRDRLGRGTGSDSDESGEESDPETAPDHRGLP